MKKRFLIGSTLALSLFASSIGVYASENDKVPELETSIETSDHRGDVVFINNDICTNTSYKNYFYVLKDNGNNMQMDFINNASSAKIWVKISINGNHVYSKFLEPGESAIYKANTANGKYDVTLDSPSGARMNTSIEARQY